MNIIFVCTGNTCRSPMAEGFMKKLFSERGCAANVMSRGISVAPGDEVSHNSVLAAGEYGVDISTHKPQMISKEDMEAADYIFTVTARHKQYLASAFSRFESKICSLAEVASCGDISDPYGGSIDVYRDSARQIYDAVQKTFQKIVDNDANQI